MSTRIRNQATRRGSDERGIFIPLLAVLAVVLVAFMRLVFDGGRIYFEQRRMQIAADAGALGGAHDLWRAQDSFVESAALADARVNHYDDGAADVAVTVNHPPLSGVRTSDADFVEVEIERTVPLGFMRIVGRSEAVVRARAVAGLVPYGGDFCIYALNKTKSSSLKVAGGAVLNSGCSAYVNSNDSDAAKFDGGSVTNAPNIAIVGGYKVQSSTINAALRTGVAPAMDPLGRMPYPDYSTLPWRGALKATNASVITASPGVYSTIAISGGIVNFQQGLYVIAGDKTETPNFKVSGGVVKTLGDGATFFLTSTEGVISGSAKDFGSIDIAGNTTIQLKAPTVSTYGGIPGILFFVDRRAPNHNHKIVGNTLSSFTGGIYVPTGNLAIRGQADALGSWQYVVADTVEFEGTSVTKNNYSGGAGSPNLPMLRAATLVE